jgi:hypothetical protein
MYPPTSQGSLHFAKVNAEQMHLIACRIIRIAELAAPEKSAGSLSDEADFFKQGATIPYLF